MSLKPDQFETFLKAVNERTLPAPLSRPLTDAQIAYVYEQLPAAFEAINMHTVTDAAFKTALASDTHLFALRERALFVQPAGLLSRKFFRFRGRMPAVHTTLVRLFTDAAGLGQHKLRFWNPLCGTGAETYSIAAMVRLAENATGAHIPNVEIIGSDLLPAALRYAEAAVYEFRRPEWRTHLDTLIRLFGESAVAEDDQLPISTKHLPAGVETFFAVERLPEGGYTIAPDEVLRNMTKFRFVNALKLAELGQLGAFDAVLAFSSALLGDLPLARQYRASLAYAVRPGGYLILPDAVGTPPDLVGPKCPFESLDPGLFCRVR